MIVPDHWAEARVIHRTGKRQLTLRRFGWSMQSVEDAQAMADARVAAALARSLAGETLERRERKLAYNGAVGVPIREEVVSRQGEEVVTRNSYGARCLNSPHALFADIDFEPRHPIRDGLVVWLVLTTLAVAMGWYLQHKVLAAGLAALALLLAAPLTRWLRRLLSAARGGPAQWTRARLLDFLARHPAWAVRVYATPNGWRLLATHQGFDPLAPEVKAFFDSVGADPLYVRMCQNQRCFRARLSAKPWRIGMTEHLRPRPGVWPVHPSRLPLRAQWVARYEQAAAGYAACRWIETLGSGEVHPSLCAVVELHDRESRALQPGLKLA
ncbi:hypothetical protein [Inhella proteolytica]|uniref:Transmembrane protein n=1 Tax=Inhella proteolytica TaxID=2795029 RepID=A0A931J8A2_9BURK|nr:hypothetical protein [Inhella proteolytica]MBH9579389.1 hypothetical protein [Inhella proteolytica]